MNSLTTIEKNFLDFYFIVTLKKISKNIRVKIKNTVREDIKNHLNDYK